MPVGNAKCIDCDRTYYALLALNVHCSMHAIAAGDKQPPNPCMPIGRDHRKWQVGSPLFAHSWYQLPATPSRASRPWLSNDAERQSDHQMNGVHLHHR
eukprot:6210245-Pleurochrysis_carterae.AAC.3